MMVEKILTYGEILHIIQVLKLNMIMDHHHHHHHHHVLLMGSYGTQSILYLFYIIFINHRILLIALPKKCSLYTFFHTDRHITHIALDNHYMKGNMLHSI